MSAIDFAAKRVLQLKTPSMKENVHPDFNVPTSLSDCTTPSLRSSASSQSATSSSRPSSSHHRRRSSVSTRRESAEMMGVSPAALSDLPTADETDTDSLRRRALWALEGRSHEASPTTPFVAGYSKVEIPELTTPDYDKKFDIYTKSPFQISNTPLVNKRDSFGRVLTPSLSSKDQLHTLIEEDEEDEENSQNDEPRAVDGSPPPQPPRVLNLRPLSLASIVPSANLTSAMPTRPGLKPLTLSTSPPVVASALPANCSNHGMDILKRRSSISYRRSPDATSPGSSHSLIIPHQSLLPTPELTPVTAERPLSPSEQAFISTNHTSLLSRITELERVLAIRTRTTSVASNSSRQLSVSSVASDAPPDEMLCLVRDLKAERDDLTRDIAVWQTRVEDLEKQISILTRRVEHERRDAWQARETVGLLEVEKRKMQHNLDDAHSDIRELQKDLRISKQAESQLLMRLENEQRKREAAEHELERQARTPRLRIDNFQSMQSFGSSTSSATEVDMDIPMSFASLKAVMEEDEDGQSDGEDELAHYEDEGEDDIGPYSDDSFSDTYTGSSFTNPPPNTRLGNVRPSVLNSLAPPLPSPSSAASSTPPPTPSPTPRAPVHERKSSLEQGWSFPRGTQQIMKQTAEVDRFFECLNFVDASPDSNFPSPTSAWSETTLDCRNKYGFFKSDDDADDDDLPPFIIPSQTNAFENTPLDIVIEEEEEGNDANFGVTPSANRLIGAKSAGQPQPYPKRKAVPSLDVDGQMQSCHAISLTNPKVTKAHALPQTPRKHPQSSIPKLSPLLPATSKLMVYPATPTSVPRVKPYSDTSKPNTTTGLLQNVSPTKLPIARMHANAKSASPSSNNTLMLKSPSTAFTALVGYFPWAGWSTTLKNNIELPKLNQAASHLSHNHLSPRNPSPSNRTTRMSMKKATLYPSVQSDGLVLL